MKKFIAFLVTIIIITVLLCETVIVGITCQKKDVFHSSYQSMIVDKYRILQNTDEKKIIMVAGSSSAFGLDQDLLEKETGYKVVNFGLHAGFGHLFYSELAKENIKPGDIVLMGFEYHWVNNFDFLGQELVMTGVDDNIDMYKHIPVKFWPEFVGYMFRYAEKKNTFTAAGGNYSRDAFDAVSGQMTWPRPYAMSDYFDNVGTYGHVTVLDENGNVTISRTSAEYLKEFKEYIEKCGATVYFVSSPILYESIGCTTDDFLRLVELEEEQIGIPYISDPRLYMFPIDLMSNAVNHCNSEGEKIRTSILVDDLRLCGALESEKNTDVTKEEPGETFALVDVLPKRFLHKPQSVNRVYRTDNDGNVIVYAEGTDYVIDYERGTIRRTENSSIPNYSDHYAAYTTGKIVVEKNAEEPNPEGNRSYQVLVDYTYYVTETELESIADSSGFLSENVRNKILSGESIDIALCGDSIGAGTDTDGQGIFLNYLQETLEEYYGVTVNTEQFSIEGRSRNLLMESLPDILRKHPDVLMIEFGMYDHCDTEGSLEDRLNSFTYDIEYMLQLIKENGIDVILVGFFQQNMTLNVENMDVTVLYNNALRDIAQRNHVYFADVYTLFAKVGNVKPLSRDVTADFICHPNEWGHKLYFTSLIDVFNVDGSMRPADLKYYVYCAA